MGDSLLKNSVRFLKLLYNMKSILHIYFVHNMHELDDCMLLQLMDDWVINIFVEHVMHAESDR